MLNLHNLWRTKVKFSSEDPMQIFFKGFYNYFSKFLHVRNQEIKLNMPKNYGINVFECEGPRSLTRLYMNSVAMVNTTYPQTQWKGKSEIFRTSELLLCRTNVHGPQSNLAYSLWILIVFDNFSFSWFSGTAFPLSGYACFALAKKARPFYN